MNPLFSLEGEDRTAFGLGLVLLAVNLGLMVAFGLAMVGIVLLSQMGANVPPWIVVTAFAISAICLWVRLAMTFPASFSLARAFGSISVGAGPVAFVTMAEYAFLFADPAGCVGAHIVVLTLGSVALVVMSLGMTGGFLLGRRMRAN